MLLISLIGEQPIPNLLPIRALRPEENLFLCTSKTQARAAFLRRLIDSPAADLLVDPYAFDATLRKLQERLAERQDVLFNLTGGTKMMALAAYALAAQRRLPFIYLESEKHANLLYRYTFLDGLPYLQEKTTLPALINTAEYLSAHLPGFELHDFPRDEHGRLNDGGLFEQAVYQSLKGRGLDVLSSIRPLGVGHQIEIDLAFRLENQVGIAEVKLGGSEGGKRGLDQLKMAGEPTYLGAYTAQFLIVAAPRLLGRASTLAAQRNITVIPLPEYAAGQPLPRPAAERLYETIRQKLTGAPQADAR